MEIEAIDFIAVRRYGKLCARACAQIPGHTGCALTDRSGFYRCLQKPLPRAVQLVLEECYTASQMSVLT